MKVAYDYPYRLKFEHADRAEIRLARAGRDIVFDPVEVREGDVVVLTSSSPDRVRATAEAVKLGRKPTVVASDEVYEWLAGLGTLDGGAAPREIDGVRFSSMRYTPPSAVRPMPQRVMAHVGALKPVATLRHLRERASLPASQPHIWELGFPDRSRLLHLDIALHSGQDDDWVERAAAAYSSPDWLVLGSGFGEGDAMVRWLGQFSPRHVLLADLVSGERRALGLPTELLTPLRDRLVTAGLEVHVFATQTSYRFE